MLPVLLELFTISGMRRRVALVAALVALFTTAGAVPGAAQQTDKQRQLAEDIQETSKAAQQARTAALAFQTERARLEATVTDLAGQVAAAQATLAAAQAQVERLAFESLVLSTQIDKTERKLANAEADTKASAVLLYKRPESASSSVTNLIGSTEGSGSIVEARQYLKHVSEKRRNDLARAQRLRKTLAVQRNELDAQQQQADDAAAKAEATKAQLEALFAQQQQARDAAARAQVDSEQSAATYTALQISLEAEKAKVDADIRALLASVGDGPRMGNGEIARPAGGGISSGFGYRTDPVNGTRAFHAGVDFALSCGTPVKAHAAGTVISAGWQGGYGNATIINHGGGMATLYGHQQSITAGAGQVVSAGEVIGYVGSTGKSTGCHLHFEVRINGNPVDPRGYL